jgi:AcrR family transcriptional regulator
MDDVAREAGVTRLIVYRIFESKDELYRAVLDLVIDDLAASFEGSPRMSPELDDQQRSIAGVLLGVARRHPDAFRLLWRHAAHEPTFRELAGLFKVAVTDYAIALFEPSMTDATMRRWAAESVVSHLYESICLWLDDGDERRDAEFLALITEGIRAMVTRWIEITRATPAGGA